MILIHTTNLTNRVKYAFDLIFIHILKVEYKFTEDKDEFYNFSGTKFSYGRTKIVEGLYFGAYNLLYEDTIIKQNLEPVEWNGIKGFCPVKNLGFLPFDPFASSFFMATRYEEYTSILKDKYNRYLAEESLAYVFNLLDKPMVNIYANEIKKILISFFPSHNFPVLKYRYCPTFDIDVAYLFKYKGFIRSSIAFAEDFVKFRFKNCIDRVLTILNLKQDPLDTYKKQFDLSDKYKLSPLYFVLLGDFGGNDKNIPHNNKNYISLIKKIDDKFQVGFHPSFGSARSIKQFQTEYNRIENILGKKVFTSRQFFNKLILPTYYTNLIDLGVTDDYSMGYNNHLGFRAGMCTSYPFFNLETNEITTLMIHPFSVVDKCFKLHLRIRASEVGYHTKQIIETVRELGGDFRIIYHNETLGTRKMWSNWITIYDDISKLALT